MVILVHFRSTFIDSTFFPFLIPLNSAMYMQAGLYLKDVSQIKWGGGRQTNPPAQKITNENLQRIEGERGLAYQLSCMSRDLYILT